MRELVLAACLAALPAAAFAVTAGDRTAAEKHWQLAQAYLKRGMPHHAREEARVAVILDPDHAAARAHLGGAPPAPAPAPVAGPAEGSATPMAPSLSTEARRAWRESRVEDARRLALSAQAAAPGDTEAAAVIRDLDAEVWVPSPLANNDVLHGMFEEGLRLFRRDAWEESAAVFQKALTLSPSHEQTRTFFNRARGRAEDGKAAAALARAREAIAAGRPAEAKAALAEVLAARPGHPEATALLESLGAGAKADERRRQAKDHFNRGVEAWEQGRWEDARRSWELVTALDPSDAEAKKLLAKARAKAAAARREGRKRIPGLHQAALKEYQSGKLDEARRLYREILDLDPDDDKAKRSLELIEGRGAGGPT